MFTYQLIFFQIKIYPYLQNNHDSDVKSLFNKIYHSEVSTLSFTVYNYVKDASFSCIHFGIHYSSNEENLDKNFTIIQFLVP